ncbi:MAG: TonB C-terminal domain-containing protein [Burkholderiales bacterium]|jgi:protein TonB|nr:TonB C-terminal domain-containing protein [Burkholderiales bacterium]
MQTKAPNRSLTIAVSVSLVLHVILLCIHFVAPEPFRFKPLDPALEIILVNSSHQQAPLKADALAQANLNGGGDAKEGRAKSPLPDMKKSVDGSALEARRKRIAELEQMQNRVLAQMATKTPQSVKQLTDKTKSQQPDAALSAKQQEEALALARREAEIAQRIQDYNKRPVKTQITPSTKAVNYALYYAAVQKRIETIGTARFPQQNGKKLYGELVMYIPIFQDGSLYLVEGGPRVERSSGNPVLDNAALAIVRSAAPFTTLPPEINAQGKTRVWEIVTRFSFSKDDVLTTTNQKDAN